MSLKIRGASNEIREILNEGSLTTLQCLLDFKKEHLLFFHHIYLTLNGKENHMVFF